MIWAIDSVGEVAYIGPEWEDFALADERSPLKARVWMHVHPDDRKACMTVFEEATRRRQPLTCVFRLLHKDGGYRRMAARGVPTIRPNDGDLIGFVGTTFEMADDDMSASTVGWTDVRAVRPMGPRSTVDRIADHLLIARAMAASSGEERLSAVCDYALKQIFEPHGLDPTPRH